MNCVTQCLIPKPSHDIGGEGNRHLESFQFSTELRHIFKLHSLLPSSLSKSIIIYRCSHLNKEDITYWISWNLHEICTCVPFFWWIWPIIWSYKKTSQQGLSEETGKSSGGEEQKSKSVGCRGRVLWLIKKKGERRFSSKMRKEKTGKNSCIYTRYYDLLPFMGIMGKNSLNIGVKIGLNWKEIQLDRMANLNWDVRHPWNGVRNVRKMAIL